MAETTTMKISVETRDRLRSLGGAGETLEDVVVAALDTYESAQFWAAANVAHAAETTAQRAERLRHEEEVDAWMGRLR